MDDMNQNLFLTSTKILNRVVKRRNNFSLCYIHVKSFCLQVSLLFEVEDLAVASPATVSRCGMVFTDYRDLGWQPYVDCWLEKRQDKVCDQYKEASLETFSYSQKLINFLFLLKMSKRYQEGG